RHRRPRQHLGRAAGDDRSGDDYPEHLEPGGARVRADVPLRPGAEAALGAPVEAGLCHPGEVSDDRLAVYRRRGREDGPPGPSGAVCFREAILFRTRDGAPMKSLSMMASRRGMSVALPKIGLFVFLALLLLASVALATAVGSVAVPVPVVVRIILNQLPFFQLGGWSPFQEAIILTIRLPRVLLAVWVGGGLAVSGVALQGLFRNPMADPGVIGVSGGAALGAVIALVSGWAFRHYLILPAFAFLGALGTVFLVYGIATRHGRTPVATLLLSGVAVGLFMVSMLSLILTRIRSIAVVAELLFWLMGGLDGRGWN